MGTSHADAHRCRRSGSHLFHPRHVLLYARHGRCNGGTRCRSHLMLCNDAGSRDVGFTQRDISSTHTRSGNVSMYLRSVDGLLHAYILIPKYECRPWQQRVVLDLLCYLHLRFRFSVPPLSGNQGAHTGGIREKAAVVV